MSERVSRRLLLAVGLALLLPTASWATVPRPTDKVILTINAEGGTAASVDFDMATLEGMGTIAVETATPWTEGLVRFEGVPLSRLIDEVAPGATRIEAIAINDYAVEIPVEDARNWDVIVATRMNGQPMSVRDKGPLWVIYPWSGHPDLDKSAYHSRSIWQLRSISLR